MERAGHASKVVNLEYSVLWETFRSKVHRVWNTEELGTSHQLAPPGPRKSTPNRLDFQYAFLRSPGARAMRIGCSSID